MIFNLNEQKVLSDPSGSSVFKGEKDFNDIVVNLPDNIDGHTATELNYVMHFVDSDGGYSTKILTVDSSGKTLKATATVSTNITSKAQAFYAYVLMTDDEETVIGKTNGVIVMIHPVPDEENEIIPPADADKIIKGLEEIVKEATETIETATDTIEEATEAISSKQDKLTAGQNITIDEDNVISAKDGGVTSYDDLTDKPVLRIQTGSTTENITIEDVIKLTPFYKIFGTDIITLDTSRLYNKIIDGIHSYTDFDSISNTTRGGVVLCSINAEGIPSFINARNRKFVLYNFEGLHDDGCAQLIFWIDNTSGESKSAFRVGTGGLWQASDWVELTGGGSQIVSGVVNANGTITFTDSDGNTFTTTGSSVIGADGFSPVATVTQTASGATVSITDSTGTTTANISNGQDGNDYVLTAQDKSDIADIVLAEFTGSIVNGELNTR